MLNTDSVLILSSDECGALSLFETDLYVLNRVKSMNVLHQSYFNCSTHISRRAGLFWSKTFNRYSQFHASLEAITSHCNH